MYDTWKRLANHLRYLSYKMTCLSRATKYHGRLLCTLGTLGTLGILLCLPFRSLRLTA